MTNKLQLTKGVRYMLLAVFLFSIMQLFVKILGDHIPSIQLVLFRALISASFSFYTIKQKKLSLWGNHKPLLLTRGLFGSLSLICFFYSLQNAPLGAVVTIVNVKPFLVLLFAMLLLGEKVEYPQWLFFLCSFLGILLIKKFDQNISLNVLLAILGAAIFASVAHICIRKLKGIDEPVTILFYFSIVTLPFALPFSIQSWIYPTWIEWVLIIGIGVFTHFAQLALTRAYQSEEVGTVSNIYYLGVVFALGYGYFFFDEKYTYQALGGILLVIVGIIANVLYKNYKQRNDKRTTQRVP
ncbi:MAG: DMT family transporter [Cytophagales bacterium]|nr:DMT family transporter [Cytophagales bacterium]